MKIEQCLEVKLGCALIGIINIYKGYEIECQSEGANTGQGEKEGLGPGPAMSRESAQWGSIQSKGGMGLQLSTAMGSACPNSKTSEQPSHHTSDYILTLLCSDLERSCSFGLFNRKSFFMVIVLF